MQYNCAFITFDFNVAHRSSFRAKCNVVEKSVKIDLSTPRCFGRDDDFL